MERLNGRPSIPEIFDALSNEETSPDWDYRILREADGKDVGRIRDVLNLGLPLGEARILLRSLENDGRR